MGPSTLNRTFQGFAASYLTVCCRRRGLGEGSKPREKMRIEQLERRCLLSVTLSGTQVTIVGTAAVDDLQILNAPLATNFIVKLNADSFTFARAAVTSIKASLLGGNDTSDIYYAPVGVNIDMGIGDDNCKG